MVRTAGLANAELRRAQERSVSEVFVGIVLDWGLPSGICQGKGYFDKPSSCDVILITNRGLL